MSEFEEIRKLLRLKRYEQPPPGYFDRFLHEFQSRQRAELLQRPAWKIAWDRFHSFFFESRVPRMALAGSFAAVLLAVAVGVATLETGPETRPADGGGAVTLASVQGGDQPETRRQSEPTMLLSDGRLDRTRHGGLLEVGDALASVRPQYVLDTRPVSYESPFSF